MRTVTLNDDEWNSLILAMASALCTAVLQHDAELAARYLHLANAVNANNPNWVPYSEDAWITKS